MKPVEISEPINKEDLQDVSGHANLFMYIHVDPKNGERAVHLRSKNHGRWDVALQLSPYISGKVLQHFDENLNLLPMKSDADAKNWTDMR